MKAQRRKRTKKQAKIEKKEIQEEHSSLQDVVSCLRNGRKNAYVERTWLTVIQIRFPFEFVALFLRYFRDEKYGIEHIHCRFDSQNARPGFAVLSLHKARVKAFTKRLEKVVNLLKKKGVL